MNHQKSILLFLLLLAINGYAQQQPADTLTIENAIQLALEKNYSIRIAGQNREIAGNNLTLGNAGFLPNVSATLNRSNTYFERFQQERASFNNDSTGTITSTQDFSENTNTAFNYGASLNWTIFDGMGMFIAYDQLGELKAAGIEDAQITIENTVADISNAYYNIIQQQERVSAFTDALKISEERLVLAQAQYEVGAGSKLNYLAAQVDYNTDKSALISQERNLNNAKVDFNQFLGREANTSFLVSDTILVDNELTIGALLEAANQQNPNLLLAQRNKNIAYLDRRLLQSQRLPQVNLFTGYTHNRQQSRASFLPNSTLSDGFNYGVSATFNIFSGFNLNRQIQNARIRQEISENQLQDLRVQVEADLQRAYNDYQNSLSLIELEKQNLDIARQNVDIALERYRIGVSTSIEFREVQRNAVNTESRLIDAEYAGKLAEIELLRLSSRIIQ